MGARIFPAPARLPAASPGLHSAAVSGITVRPHPQVTNSASMGDVVSIIYLVREKRRASETVEASGAARDAAIAVIVAAQTHNGRTAEISSLTAPRWLYSSGGDLPPDEESSRQKNCPIPGRPGLHAGRRRGRGSPGDTRL